MPPGIMGNMIINISLSLIKFPSTNNLYWLWTHGNTEQLQRIIKPMKMQSHLKWRTSIETFSVWHWMSLSFYLRTLVKNDQTHRKSNYPLICVQTQDECRCGHSGYHWYIYELCTGPSINQSINFFIFLVSYYRRNHGIWKLSH